MAVKHLFVVSGASALIGAGLMAYKGAAILIGGDQPAHAFEIAPFFFGLSALALTYGVIGDMSRPLWLLLTLGWLATLGGAVAAVAHFVGKEDDFGDLGYLVNIVSTVALFLLISGAVRHNKLLGSWSFTPLLVAWAIILSIPIGAALEAIEERLLEIALLGMAGGWTMLGVAALRRAQLGTRPDETHA